MNLSSLAFAPALISIATLGLGLAGVLIWFVIRKRQNRIWFPILRVMELPSKRLPLLTVTPPPWLRFFCFLLAALTVIFFGFYPTQKLFLPLEPGEARVHVFLDMSPSNQAYANLSSYFDLVNGLLKNLSGRARLSISTSHSPEIYQIAKDTNLPEIFQKLDFHRGGVQLGQAVSQQIATIGELDRLLVVSDGDYHSWSDFNWRFLADQTQVFWVPTRDMSGKKVSNVFVQRVDNVSVAGTSEMQWQVELSRRGSEGELRGQLRASFAENELATLPWSFPPGKNQITLQLNWPLKKLQASADYMSLANVLPLVFSIEVHGDDAVKVDNEYRTKLFRNEQNALLIADVAGEMLLEDPTFHLQDSLEVMDFKLKRLDSIAQPGPKPKDFPLWIIVGGGPQGIDRYCPKSLESMRLEQNNAKEVKTNNRAPVVWLVPQYADADFKELCYCFSRLAVSRTALTAMPAYCKSLGSRETYIGALSSLGAKPIGGETSDITGALAMHLQDEHTGLEVLGFTVPLQPLKSTGISYGRLPLIINELLTWLGLTKRNTGKRALDWPRIGDISEKNWGEGLPLFNPALWAQSNVPVGESVLNFLPVAQLPKIWMAANDPNRNQLLTKEERDDPMPWVQLCFYAVLFAIFLELIWTIVNNVVRLSRRNLSKALLLLITAAFGARGPEADAQVVLNVVAREVFEKDIKILSQEVAHRTSIDLNPMITSYPSINEAALQQAWLWVKDLSMIADHTGRLRGELAEWVKKGGFLVLEGAYQTSQLTQLMAKVAPPDATKAAWQPIPPDHELMRSFHLLDALPVCQERVWQGFQFDGRLAVLYVPLPFLEDLYDEPVRSVCAQAVDRERASRIFINLLMVVLATDYKKDQIHLPEILKRLR